MTPEDIGMTLIFTAIIITMVGEDMIGDMVLLGPVLGLVVGEEMRQN
jgi:hypothetical protein